MFLEPAAAGQRALSIAAWFGFARWKNGVAVGLHSESDQGSVERNRSSMISNNKKMMGEVEEIKKNWMIEKYIII